MAKDPGYLRTQKASTLLSLKYSLCKIHSGNIHASSDRQRRIFDVKDPRNSRGTLFAFVSKKPIDRKAGAFDLANTCATFRLIGSARSKRAWQYLRDGFDEKDIGICLLRCEISELSRELRIFYRTRFRW